MLVGRQDSKPKFPEVSRFVTMAYVGISPNQSFLFSGTTKHKHSLHLPSLNRSVVSVRAESMTIEKLGIKIERNPPEDKLTQLGVKQWPKYFSFCFILVLLFLNLVQAIIFLSFSV